jgi:hypothetical protein
MVGERQEGQSDEDYKKERDAARDRLRKSEDPDYKKTKDNWQVNALASALFFVLAITFFVLSATTFGTGGLIVAGIGLLISSITGAQAGGENKKLDELVDKEVGVMRKEELTRQKQPQRDGQQVEMQHGKESGISDELIKKAENVGKGLITGAAKTSEEKKATQGPGNNQQHGSSFTR